MLLKLRKPKWMQYRLTDTTSRRAGEKTKSFWTVVLKNGSNGRCKRPKSALYPQSHHHKGCRQQSVKNHSVWPSNPEIRLKKRFTAKQSQDSGTGADEDQEQNWVDWGSCVTR